MRPPLMRVGDIHTYYGKSHVLYGVSLEVGRGEVVGLLGRNGVGKSTTLKAIMGLVRPSQGTVLFEGQSVTHMQSDKLARLGIAYVPEDRRKHGVILSMAVSPNITLAALPQLSHFGSLDFRREKEIAVDYTRRLGIKTSSIFAPVASLSGGNQQKVALSRWLVTKPAVLILDEPTQGIDIGAKAEIHALMTQLAAQGTAILMISSELAEILGMSDRVAIINDGTICGLLDRSEATQAKILALALGHDLSETEEPGITAEVEK